MLEKLVRKVLHICPGIWYCSKDNFRNFESAQQMPQIQVSTISVINKLALSFEE
jgi:hypothetical protein